MWSAIAPVLSTGGLGAVLLVAYWLHRDAVKAHERRADDWRAAAEAAAKRADLKDTQMGILLGRHNGEREPML